MTAFSFTTLIDNLRLGYWEMLMGEGGVYKGLGLVALLSLVILGLILLVIQREKRHQQQKNQASTTSGEAS